MSVFSGFLSFVSSLFSPVDPSTVRPQHPISVGCESLTDYAIPEVKKVLPGTLQMQGCYNMIGLESVELTLKVETTDVQELEKIAFQALEAAQRGLKNCKKLYNYTNHSPDSPFLMMICVKGPTSHLSCSVRGGKFYPPGQLQSIPEFETILPGTELYKAILEATQDLGFCRERSMGYYLTSLEPSVPAIGLDFWVDAEQLPASDEEFLNIYRAKYKLLQEAVLKIYPGHFLMLRLHILKNDEKHDVAVTNIRNHLWLTESKQFEPQYRWQWHLNALDDLVPERLHREFYKGK